MLDRDRPAFGAIMAGVATNYGRDLTDDLLSLFWAVLADHTLEEVTHAFNAHVRVSRFMPTIADILDRIVAAKPDLARPGADEAWLKTPPEDLSYWATDEMLGAWSVVAEEMHSDRPDKIAARMAFKDAYTRLVDQARTQGRPVKWHLVRGTRNDNLEDAIREGMRLGYMPREEGESMLRIECQRHAGLLPLLEGAVASNNEIARQAVAKLKAILNPPQPTVDWGAVSTEMADTERKIAMAMAGAEKNRASG